MENILIAPFVDKTLILTKRGFGDGHLTATCLTRNHGLLKAFAFGGKRISKRFKGSLEYFRIMEVEFVPKQSNGELLFTLSAVKETKHTYKNVSSNINKYITACYIQELASTLLNPLEQTGKSGTCYFDTVAQMLEQIDTTSEALDCLIDIAYNFCVFMFHETGFIPKLEVIKSTKKQLHHMEELHSSILGNSPKSFLMLSELITNEFASN